MKLFYLIKRMHDGITKCKNFDAASSKSFTLWVKENIERYPGYSFIEIPRSCVRKIYPKLKLDDPLEVKWNLPWPEDNK